MQLGLFRFSKLINLGIALNLCISGHFEGHFEGQLENHGEIQHVGRKYMEFKSLKHEIISKITSQEYEIKHSIYSSTSWTF